MHIGMEIGLDNNKEKLEYKRVIKVLVFQQNSEPLVMGSRGIFIVFFITMCETNLLKNDHQKHNKINIESQWL